MPTAFLYLRETAIIPREEQWKLARDYYERNLHPNGFEVFEFYFFDNVESRKHDFCHRQAARECLKRCQPGDAIVVVSLANAFRNHADFLLVEQILVGLHIDLHIAETSRTNDEQRIRNELIAELAEAEIERKHESAKDRYAQCRKDGKSIGRPPVGMKWAGRRGRRRLIPDKRELQVIQTIRELSTAGRSLDEIFWILVKEGIRRRGGREWGRTTIWHVIRANAFARIGA